jgi:hypothetical protein
MKPPGLLPQTTVEAYEGVCLAEYRDNSADREADAVSDRSGEPAG